MGGVVAMAEGCAVDRPLGDALETATETGTDSTKGPDAESVSSAGGPSSTVASEVTTAPATTETPETTTDGDSAEPEPEPEATAPPSFVVAIDETFDDWDGSRWHALENGEDVYDDNNTVALVDGHEAFTVHADGVDDSGYGVAIGQFLGLDQRTDMSGEDFHITFDVYIPSRTAAHDPAVLFGFYETQSLTPIFSAWHQQLPAEQWVTISANIDIDSGGIEYSAFVDNPGDWIFDAVVIELLATGESAAPGTELLFYVDNVLVTNAPE